MEGDDAMATIGSGMTVNEVLREFPATLAVLNRYGVDTCCGGGAALPVAAAAAGISLEEFVAALEAAARQGA